MNQYKQKAAEVIVRDLRFTEDQLDIVGRLLFMEDEKELVKYVKIECGGGVSIHPGGPELPRNVNVYVILQENLETEGSNEVKKKIKDAARKLGIDSREIVSYHEFSYGIEMSNVDVHFEFDYED